MTDLNKEFEGLDPNEMKFIQEVKEEAEKALPKEDIKTEDVVEDTTNVVEDRTPEELEAIEMGWKPDHKGENFVSAKEFIRVGQIIKAKREATKKVVEVESELQELKKGMSFLLEHNKKVETVAYERAMSDLTARKREAIEAGDVQAFESVEREAERLKTTQPTQQPAQPQYTQAQLDFANRNRSWFNPDPNNTDLVSAVEHTYNYVRDVAQKKGLNITEEQMLQETEKMVKNNFKDRFEKDGITKSKEAKVALVETPTKSAGARQETNLTFDDRIRLKQIQMADPKFSEADYKKLKDQLSK